MRNTARRGISQITAVQNFDELTPEEKIRHNTDLSSLGVMKQFTSAKNRVLLEEAVREAAQPIAIEKTLELFMRK